MLSDITRAGPAFLPSSVAPKHMCAPQNAGHHADSKPRHRRGSVLGFVAGYAVRAAISHHRHVMARRSRL